MPKFRKHPTGEFPGYPFLNKEDMTHEVFEDHGKFMAQGLVEDRLGRVVVKMEGQQYLKFLDAVRKKYGNIWVSSVDKAMKEAVEWFIEETGD